MKYLSTKLEFSKSDLEPLTKHLSAITEIADLGKRKAEAVMEEDFAVAMQCKKEITVLEKDHLLSLDQIN